MKNNSTYLTILFMIVGISIVSAQESNGTVNTQALVDSKRFVVQIQSVSPLRGGVRQLSPGNKLVVSPDTVISDLPYFGRSYQATINPSDAGIKFTSTDFQYEVKVRKKGGWDIKIRPKDEGKSYQLFLTITNTGHASMRITSTDKESISYNGFIEEIKRR